MNYKFSRNTNELEVGEYKIKIPIKIHSVLKKAAVEKVEINITFSRKTVGRTDFLRHAYGKVVLREN